MTLLPFALGRQPDLALLTCATLWYIREGFIMSELIVWLRGYFQDRVQIVLSSGTVWRSSASGQLTEKSNDFPQIIIRPNSTGSSGYSSKDGASI